MTRDSSSRKSSDWNPTPGQALRAARKKAGLSQEQLAKRIGCTDGFVSQLERDRTHPGPDILARLVAHLRIPGDLWPGLAVRANEQKDDPRRDPIFFDFTARIAGHKWLRRAVIALADPAEIEHFEAALRRAEEVGR